MSVAQEMLLWGITMLLQLTNEQTVCWQYFTQAQTGTQIGHFHDDIRWCWVATTIRYKILAKDPGSRSHPMPYIEHHDRENGILRESLGFCQLPVLNMYFL